jgi:RND family efflux transporter MFP subunit
MFVKANMSSRFPLLVLITTVGAGCSGRMSAEAAGEKREITPVVEVATLEAEPFTTHIEATGTALAARESYLSCPVPGRIEEILVERGEAVVEGQLLVRLDQKGYRLGLKQAQAGLSAASSQVEQVQQELDKLEPLLEQGAVAKAEIERLETQKKGASAQVGMAAAGKKQAKKALDDSLLRAPYDGVITDIYHEVGEHATAMPPTMLAKIVDAATLEVQVFLPEDASPHVKVGTMAEVTVESADLVLEGEVIFVSDVIQPVTHTFEVRIRLENAGGAIKAGAFARVSLVRESLESAVLVPITSVRRDGDETPFAFVVEDGKALRKDVTLGEQVGSRVLVVKGLAPGDVLVTAGHEDLLDGQKVTIEKPAP